MKKMIATTLASIIILVSSVPTFAYNYGFESGADSKSTFGIPSPTSVQPQNPELDNIRRNKDASYIPPAYGVFSGDIDTPPSSIYHDNSQSGSASFVTNPITQSPYGSSMGTLGNTSITGSTSQNTNGMATGNVNTSDTGSIIATSIIGAEATETMPMFYADGSIGTLSIPKIKVSVKVFEGETLDSMKKGSGHFEFTSSWDGNIGLAGHNRGSTGYFEGVKNLAVGDTMTYITKYGTRKYEVFYKEKISDTDYSNLGWSAENILTLITCVENTPNLRWCIQAREVK